MSKKVMRNPMERHDNMSVAYEISEQDLAGKSGAGVNTAVQMTLAGKCGNFFTISYECSSNHVPCA